MFIDKSQLSRAVQILQGRVEDAIVFIMKAVGEEFIVNARSTNTYKDRTGNLRSSIGYVILKDGKQLVGSEWVKIQPVTGGNTKRKTRRKIRNPKNKPSMAGPGPRNDDSILQGSRGADPSSSSNSSGGIDTGKQLLQDLAQRYNKGFVLICVAGMEYAAAVEAKGYDVITSSSFIALEHFKNSIENLRYKVSNIDQIIS